MPVYSQNRLLLHTSKSRLFTLHFFENSTNTRVHKEVFGDIQKQTLKQSENTWPQLKQRFLSNMSDNQYHLHWTGKLLSTLN